jgi:uncharacterized protein YbbC (DUF1343 family)
VRVDLPKNLAELGPMYGGQYLFMEEILKIPTIRYAFDHVAADRFTMLDKVTGTTELTLALKNKQPVKPIIDNWAEDVREFKQRRQKYLLY